MEIVVEAVYEKGILKPLKKLDLREGEKVRIKIERSIVEETRGILKNKNIEKVIEEIESGGVL